MTKVDLGPSYTPENYEADNLCASPAACAVGACIGITSRGRRCGRVGCRAHRKQRRRPRGPSVYEQMVGRTRREIFDFADQQVARVLRERGDGSCDVCGGSGGGLPPCQCQACCGTGRAL